jgi:hypothetical protein
MLMKQLDDVTARLPILGDEVGALPDRDHARVADDIQQGVKRVLRTAIIVIKKMHSTAVNELVHDVLPRGCCVAN